MAGTLDQSATVGGGNNYFGRSDRLYAHQGFTPSVSGKCTQIDVDLKIGAGSPTGTIFCYLYTDNGADKPGTLIATINSMAASSLTASYVFYSFSIDANIAPQITKNTKYHIVLLRTPADDANYVHWDADTAGGYAAGQSGHSGDGLSWTNDAGIDNDFKQYYTILSGGGFLLNFV